MPNIVFDNQPLTVAPGTTILEAAASLGVRIPTLCHREGCRAETSCLVCVVKVNGAERLAPSCATLCAEGMVIESETPEVHHARQVALELLLGDHRGDCVAPCHYICPANLDIPRMIELVKAGRMRDAVALTRESIPFPAVLGRICPEFCEKGCRRADVDSPVSIRLLKRSVGDYDLACAEPYVPPCAPDTGKRVAIIGAGPAGLSAAYYLRQAGHGVTVLEAAEHPGGGLATGVSPRALPPAVLAGEIANLRRVGFELRLGARVDRAGLERLQHEYDAVLVACGELTEAQAGALGLSWHGKGVAHDRHTLMTGRLGVFVAGSALTPSHHAVRAVGTGRLAAEAICRHLAGEHIHVEYRPYTVLMGRLDPGEMALFSAAASGEDRLSPAGGEELGFGADEMRREAARCLECDCSGVHSCRLRHWGHIYEANPHRMHLARKPFERDLSHPDLVYEPGKCITCGLCVQLAERHREALGLSFIGRGCRVRVGVPFDASLAEGLAEVARECAAACPTAALTWRGG
jgi:NADPH-dependent 2,4-dienoyl-CoA reductase/sulfur reductase-like enzyme/ferredoxin